MATFSREQLAFFIQHGYLIIKPTLTEDEAFHKTIVERCEVLEESGDLGNNLLPDLPQLGKLLDAPELVAALKAILGESYAMMTHRHLHLTEEGSRDQPFHRDSFFGFEQFRHVVPCDVMVLYYPQVVTQHMGPTALLPGSHFARGQVNSAGMEFRPASWGDDLDQLFLATDVPGVCVIMHYHLWHRGTGREKCRKLPDPSSPPPIRWMFKFQFRRTQAVGSESGMAVPFCPLQEFKENPFLKACRQGMDGNAADKADEQLLPVPLRHVKEGALQSWTAFCAPTWAAIWAAMNSESTEVWNCISQACSAKHSMVDSDGDHSPEDMRRQLILDLAGMLAMGFTQDSLRTQVACLGSSDSTVRQSAAHALAFACACGAWPSDKMVEALMPVLRGEVHGSDDRVPRIFGDEEETSDTESNGQLQEKEEDKAEATEEKAAEAQEEKEEVEEDEEAEAKEETSPKKARWGQGEAQATLAWLGSRKGNAGCILSVLHARCLAAAALQLLRTPLREGTEVGAAFSALLSEVAENEEDFEHLPMQGAHWSLEVISAVPAVLPPREAVECLTAFLKLPVPRCQLHASIALYSAAVRCDAPFSEGSEARAFRDAVAKCETEMALLSVVEFWVEEWAPARRRRAFDGGGRYALAEALRCLGYFASKEVARKAAILAGAVPEIICAGAEKVWRKRFVRFIERSWECPMTSPQSPF